MSLEQNICQAHDHAAADRRRPPTTETFETTVDDEYAVGLQDEEGGRIASTVAVMLEDCR